MRTQFRVALVAALACVSSPSFAVQNFFSEGGTGGVVAVNLSNGQINHCGALYNSQTYAPVGRCAVIGSIPTTNLSGNIKIDFTPNAIAYITNTQSGLTVECSLITNSVTGVPAGRCITFQLQ